MQIISDSQYDNTKANPIDCIRNGSIPPKINSLRPSDTIYVSRTYHHCSKYFSEIWFKILKFSFALENVNCQMAAILSQSQCVNTLRPRQNGRHFPDIFKWIFLNENVWISIQISLKFVPKGSIKYIPALVQIMAWRQPGDKPLSEPMMVVLPKHICVTRPQCVKLLNSLTASPLLCRSP